MTPDYSRAGLERFLDMLDEKGYAKANTVVGLRVACAKVLADLSKEEETDVRKIDVDTTIQKVHNKNPNELSPRTLGEYRRRVKKAIAEFARYVENPTGFRPLGSASGTTRGDGKKKERAARNGNASDTSSRAVPPGPTPASALTLSYPLREDFLVQVVVPRDLKLDEARRLSHFILTLSREYAPKD